jgi:uncharacterized glyoxalase superfamily protein PhnB
MTLNHVHFQVQDLKAAINWFETILHVRPGFQNERLATFSLNSLTVIVDAGSIDTAATLGFESDDCDRDFRAVVQRGAIALQPPTNQDWGVRAGYFKGPGGLKCEIEGS